MGASGAKLACSQEHKSNMVLNPLMLSDIIFFYVAILKKMSTNLIWLLFHMYALIAKPSCSVVVCLYII